MCCNLKITRWSKIYEKYFNELFCINLTKEKKRRKRTTKSIRLSEKCLSFANLLFTTVYLHTNVKPNMSNVAVFTSTEQNGSYVIRQNNIKQETLYVYYFLIKRKKLFGQPNTFHPRDLSFAHYQWTQQ